MHRSRKPNAPSPPPRWPSKTAGIILRVAIWGAVVVAVILGYLELRARNDYRGTIDAWIAAQEQADNEGKDFRKSHLEGLVRGNPKITVEDVSREQMRLARKRGTYTWHGILDDYTVHVNFGLPNDDPEVLLIEQTSRGGRLNAAPRRPRLAVRTCRRNRTRQEKALRVARRRAGLIILIGYSR